MQLRRSWNVFSQAIDLKPDKCSTQFFGFSHPGQTAEGLGFLVQIPESRRSIANALGISTLRQLKSGLAARSGESFDRREY